MQGITRVGRPPDTLPSPLPTGLAPCATLAPLKRAPRPTPAPVLPAQVVAGTNTGKSPQLASYYGFWERAIFNALNQMVLNAMNALQVGGGG